MYVQERVRGRHYPLSSRQFYEGHARCYLKDLPIVKFVLEFPSVFVRLVDSSKSDASSGVSIVVGAL